VRNRHAAAALLSIWEHKLLRFAIVGGIATLIQYLTLIGSVELWHWNAVVASSVGYFLGAIANYLLNYYFTFRSDNRHRVAAARFAIVAVAGLALNALLMALLAEKLRLPYVVAQVLATVGTLIWNYWANSIWSFGRRSSRQDDAHGGVT
jgi:putative flippase GtrA